MSGRPRPGVWGETEHPRGLSRRGLCGALSGHYRTPPRTMLSQLLRRLPGVGHALLDVWQRVGWVRLVFDTDRPLELHLAERLEHRRHVQRPGRVAEHHVRLALVVVILEVHGEVAVALHTPLPSGFGFFPRFPTPIQLAGAWPW